MSKTGKRSKGFIKSELKNIQGIGEKMVEKLFAVFGSVENIKNKSVEELAVVVGKSKAKQVLDYFRGKKE